VTPAGVEPGAVKLEHIRQHRLEGLVAKRLDSP
jgi:hypothetical protein